MLRNSLRILTSTSQMRYFCPNDKHSTWHTYTYMPMELIRQYRYGRRYSRPIVSNTTSPEFHDCDRVISATRSVLEVILMIRRDVAACRRLTRRPWQSGRDVIILIHCDLCLPRVFSTVGYTAETEKREYSKTTYSLLGYFSKKHGHRAYRVLVRTALYDDKCLL